MLQLKLYYWNEYSNDDDNKVIILWNFHNSCKERDLNK